MLSPDGSLELSSTLGGLLMGFAGAEGTKGWSESHRRDGRFRRCSGEPTGEASSLSQIITEFTKWHSLRNPHIPGDT